MVLLLDFWHPDVSALDRTALCTLLPPGDDDERKIVEPSGVADELSHAV